MDEVTSFSISITMARKWKCFTIFMLQIFGILSCQINESLWI